MHKITETKQMLVSSNSRRMRQKNMLTFQQYGGTSFANQRLEFIFTQSSPTNKAFFRTFGSPLVDDRPITNALKCRVVSGVVWTNRTIVSSYTDTNRTDPARLTSYQGDPTEVRTPAGFTPDFHKLESCWAMPLVGGFSRGFSVHPVPSFRHCSMLTSITLIGSQDLAAKSHPNIFTHSACQYLCILTGTLSGVRPVKHALNDSAPIADLQGNKKLIPYCQMWGNTRATANEQTSEYLGNFVSKFKDELNFTLMYHEVSLLLDHC
ncbi:hypothetical protein PR048_012163 [Dryococelus australis]|uniref:Uncharacterized protein n=1 Tax=Dryococelus australis TaxID=614101 RepID=A0ABQ9HNQ1_9NEOP|nr:hypothetical protein PR048_012163 [Dryococelus australis]